MSYLKTMRAQALLVLLSRGGVKEVNIPEIPEDWDFFLGTKDKWVEVIFPDSEKSTNALYVGEKGSIFPAHVHRYSDEMITVMNKEGKIKIITDKEVKYLTFGQTYVIPYGVPHAVVFEEETKLFIHWHPHFKKGWSAEFFINQDKK